MLNVVAESTSSGVADWLALVLPGVGVVFGSVITLGGLLLQARLTRERERKARLRDAGIALIEAHARWVKYPSAPVLQALHDQASLAKESSPQAVRRGELLADLAVARARVRLLGSDKLAAAAKNLDTLVLPTVEEFEAQLRSETR